MQSHQPTRRVVLQAAAAAGLAAGPTLGTRAAAASAAIPTSAAALPPDLSIIDAHVHLWDLAHFPLPWVAGDPVLNQSYLLQDFEAQAAPLGVTGLVYVQVDVPPEYSLLEADWVVERAAEDPFIMGVVAHAPLEYGDGVRTYLDSLMTRGPLIKGIRRLLQGEADPRYGSQPDFIRGVQMLAEYGLSFDLLVKGTPQMPSAIEIARRAPDTSIILDHLLKPEIVEHTLDPWRAQMQELASYPNVVTKISGLVTEADLKNWKPDDLRPYVEHAVSVFGEDRIVFGGDWPPVLDAAPYARWVETADALTGGLSLEGKRKFFGDNARRFYRLEAVG